MVKPVVLPRWVHLTKLFQERPLLNRAVLDTLGFAVPSILLTRNPVERREQMLDRALVIGSAFFLAPLHAWLFLRLFARKLPSHWLMHLSYKDLLSPKAFKAGLQKLAQTIAQDSQGKILWTIPKRLLQNQQFANVVRRQVVDKKSHMLLWDLLTEALVFSNMRFITNAVTRHLTGKNQFTGVYGALAQEKLDKLHQKETHHFSERTKQIFNNILAITIPPVLALSLKHAVLNPKNQSMWAKGLRSVCAGFDYNKGIYLGMGALAVITAMQLLGYAMAARDKYELREKMLVQNIGNYIFFCGNWTWMKILGPLLLSGSKQPAVRSIQEAITHQKVPGAIQKSAKWAALFYWLCFLCNNISFASLVVTTNKSTIRKVKTDAAHLEKPPQKKSVPTVPALKSPPVMQYPIATVTWAYPSAYTLQSQQRGMAGVPPARYFNA